jgi:hypothetical protein
MEVEEIRLKLAAAERAAEAADRNVKVNYWRDKEIAKRDKARAKVAALANRLSELEGQRALRL